MKKESLSDRTSMASATKSVPLGSFPELLRRSRFASFDPTIRQSYGTPPSHLHRGDWGLKRPLSKRKRNAFISLKNFEEHEHYIEWNNAESQVRLIDKIEELNFTPKLVPSVPWYVGLGPAAASPWSKMDSEFAPGESGMLPLPKAVPIFTPQLEGLGLRGKGEYGMKPSTKISDDGYLHPNLRAMSPKVFKRFLKKLRALRPEFQKFLKENGVTTSIRESGMPPGNLHIRFLGQYFDKQFQDTGDAKDLPKDGRNEKKDVHPNQTQPIRQQPHRLGGLMYASPTLLESFLTSPAQPAIVLEDGSQTNYNNSKTAKSYFVSTAGIIGRLEEKRAGPNIQPVFNSGGVTYPPAVLLARQTSLNTFINVKVIDLQLERLPEAVTAFPSANSSREVSIRMEVAVHSNENNHSRTNTHPPGSMLYNAPEDSQRQMHSKIIFNRNAANIYSKNRLLNKLNVVYKDVDSVTRSHEEREKTNPNNNDGILSRLDQLQTKDRILREAGVVLKPMGWDDFNRQSKPDWLGGQWNDGLELDKKGGGTG